MKLRHLLFSTIAAFALTITAAGQQPENLEVEYFHWTTRPLQEMFLPAPTLQEGVWVMVFVSDPKVEALSITLNYRDDTGRDLSRTELIPRWYRDRAAWTNHLFVTGKVRVRSILVTPLKPAEVTRLVEVEEN